MTTLFSTDDYPTGTDPVRAWRQAEAELEALKKRLQETPDPSEDERGLEAKAFELDPVEYAALFAAAKEYRALQWAVWDLEGRVEELGAAALRACKD